MEIGQIEAFVQTVHAGSFTKAAESLHLSQLSDCRIGSQSGLPALYPQRS